MNADLIFSHMEMECQLLQALRRYKRSHLYLLAQLKDMSEMDLLGRIDFLANHGLITVKLATRVLRREQFWVTNTDKVPSDLYQQVALLHKLHNVPLP